MAHWLDTYYRVGQAAAATEGAYFAQLEYVTKLLRDVGIPEQILAYCLAQVMYETADLTSNKAQKYNNLSGIKCVNQKMAAGCSKDGFAIYKTDADWAHDYARILSLPPGRPIGATSAQDFIQGLRANGYFTRKEDNQYVAGFNAKLKKVGLVLSHATELGKQYASGKMNKYTTGQSLAPTAVKVRNANYDEARASSKMGQWIKDHPLIAGGAAVLAVVVITNSTK